MYSVCLQVCLYVHIYLFAAYMLTNLFKILPFGVVSKKVIGACITFWNSFLWSSVEAERDLQTKFADFPIATTIVARSRAK